MQQDSSWPLCLTSSGPAVLPRYKSTRRAAQSTPWGSCNRPQKTVTELCPSERLYHQKSSFRLQSSSLATSVSAVIAHVSSYRSPTLSPRLHLRNRKVHQLRLELIYAACIQCDSWDSILCDPHKLGPLPSHKWIHRYKSLWLKWPHALASVLWLQWSSPAANSTCTALFAIESPHVSINPLSVSLWTPNICTLPLSRSPLHPRSIQAHRPVRHYLPQSIWI